MISTRRYEGLQYLQIFGLPTPNFQTVYSVKDIENLQLSKAPYGWTIRTCHINGLDEMGLFYRNNLKHTEIEKVLTEKFKTHGSEFYVVYKSWKFLTSLNVFSENRIFYIEGNYGTQKSISMGKKVPDFVISIPFGLGAFLKKHSGILTEEAEFWVLRVNYYLRKIFWDDFFAEVAVTQKNDIMFYELRKIETSA